MEKTIFEFILKYSKKQQIILVFLTLISFPFLYATLELPKIIINEAIGGIDFPKFVEFPTFGIDIELEQIEFLFALSFGFLMLVLMNGLFKYTINVYKGRLGENMLRLLRTKIYQQIIRLPLAKFKKIRHGETISIISAEVEPLGGFIGDAVALPMFQGGTLLVYIGFIFVQDPKLGLAAVALYPIQIYIIPKLQRQVNQLAKRRIQNVRKLSTHIGESLSGIQEIYLQDTSEYEESRLKSRLNRIFNIRYDIYKKKFFIKFLNNLLSHVTPFFFYLIGGYMVIEGELTSGALVAVIAAYKDLSSPWKELLSYYQQKEDVKIKYQQIIEQFVLNEEKTSTSIIEGDFEFKGTVSLNQITLINDTGHKVIDKLSHEFSEGHNTLIIGSTDSGTDSLAIALAGLVPPDHGKIVINGVAVENLSQKIKGENIGYLDQSPYIATGTVKDNLYYGCLKVVDDQGNYDSEAHYDIHFDKTPFETNSDLEQHILKTVKLVKLDNDLYTFGLNHYFDDDELDETLSHLFIQARKKFYEKIHQKGWQNLIEPFNVDKYNINTSVAENLIFGTPKSRQANIERLASYDWVHRILDKFDLYDTLLEKGLQAVEILVEIFSAAKKGFESELFERFSFASSEKLTRIKEEMISQPNFSLRTASFDQQVLLLSIGMSLTVGRHRLGLITEDIQKTIIEARHYLIENIPNRVRRNINFFNMEEYNPGLTCRNNILYGHISHTAAEAAEKTQQLIDEVIDELCHRDMLIFIGLEKDVGTSGASLSSYQKQKLALARSLVKKPKMLILNHALSALDKPSVEAILKSLMKEFEGRSVIMIDYDETYLSYFDEYMEIVKGIKTIDKPVPKKLIANGEI